MEAHYVLDEIVANATDLPITEHATDTQGVMLVNFALFDRVGLRFSPRIRDLGKITMYRVATLRFQAGLARVCGGLVTWDPLQPVGVQLSLVLPQNRCVCSSVATYSSVPKRLSAHDVLPLER